jgi:hypothetical protein
LQWQAQGGGGGKFLLGVYVVFFYTIVSTPVANLFTKSQEVHFAWSRLLLLAYTKLLLLVNSRVTPLCTEQIKRKIFKRLMEK